MLKEDFSNLFRETYTDRCYYHWGFFHEKAYIAAWNTVIVPEENIHTRYNIFSAEFEEWACENIHTRWTYVNTNTERGSPIRTFYFEDKAAAVLFKLTWG